VTAGDEPAAGLFGRIALKKGLVTEEQLGRALRLQEELRFVGLARPLGRLLVDEGLLAEGQVELILRLQAINQRAKDGKAFARIALRNELLSQHQLDAALAVVKAEGWERSLEAVLVDQGALEPRAVRAVRAAMDRAKRRARGEAGTGTRPTARPSTATGRLAQQLDIDDDDADAEADLEPGERERLRLRADVAFAAVAVRDGALLIPELERAVDEQALRSDPATMPRGATPPSLEEVLVAQGALTPQEAKQVRQRLEAARKETLALPGYELTGVLGHGVTSLVLRARHALIGRDVAIKLFRPEHALDPDALLGEARQAARVRHENVVELFEAGRAHRRFYFVMELVDGPTLARRLRDQGPLPIADALRMALDVARGLQAIHAAGLVHRDVKPQNILFAPDGRAKLTDLGLACEADRAPVDGAIYGSPHTMSPEQAQGLAVDARADLYGLGATLYQALTEVPPYEGSEPMSILMAHLTAPVPDVRLGRRDAPPPLAALVTRLLQKEPAARPQGAGEVVQTLSGMLAFEA
jgi:hypothetical protein